MSDKTHDNKGSKKHYIKMALWVLLCLLAVIVLRLVSWVFNNWANLRTDELIYTLTSSLDGTNPFMIRSAVLYITIPAIIIVLALVLVFVILKGSKRKKYFCIITSIVAIIVFFSSIGYFVHKVGIIEYYKNKNIDSDFIELNYVDPGSVAITFPEEKRNLIFIFIESMETTFADQSHGGGEEINIIPELTQIGSENQMFAGDDIPLNGASALPGATYTMGGLFAQTSGMPLIIPNTEISQTDGFFPGITAIGDILEDQGYHNVFFIGTDASFGQRDIYFECHGNYDIFDYYSAIEEEWIPSDYQRDWWGYDDYTLYENAKTELLELAASGEPFNFTMLTVDTHAEDGYMCEDCDNIFDEHYANVFHCADRQAGEFIRWIQEQDFYENTTIVVTGDHCTMDSDFCSDISSDYDRRVYSVFINPVAEPIQTTRREYSTMDIFPTTLAALGATIEGDRLGLGTNLFSNRSTLVEMYGLDYVYQELSKNSPFFYSFLGEELDLGVHIEYDESPESILIRIDSENTINTNNCERIYCKVTHTFPGFYLIKEYDLESVDGELLCEIPMRDFFYDNGNYHIEILMRLNDGLLNMYTSEEYEIDNVDNPTDISASIDQDGTTLTISWEDDGEFSHYWFPVWSAEDGQDDLYWYYVGDPNEQGTISYEIPLDSHIETGDLIVELYGGYDYPQQILNHWLLVLY